jgi:hypothetical protein
MSKTQIYTLVIAVTICLLATAGFMGISSTGQAASGMDESPLSK